MNTEKKAIQRAFKRFDDEAFTLETELDADINTELCRQKPGTKYFIRGPGPECLNLLRKHGLQADDCIVIVEKGSTTSAAFHYQTFPFTTAKVLAGCARVSDEQLEQALVEFVNLSLVCGTIDGDEIIDLNAEALVTLLMSKAGFGDEAAVGNYSFASNNMRLMVG